MSELVPKWLEKAVDRKHKSKTLDSPRKVEVEETVEETKEDVKLPAYGQKMGKYTIWKIHDKNVLGTVFVFDDEEDVLILKKLLDKASQDK
jgi:hypothetical protein